MWMASIDLQSHTDISYYNFLMQCEKLRNEAAALPGLKAELEALKQRHFQALELMGERD
jgi:hypothetical protein